MHGPAALAGLSLGFDWVKPNDSNSPTTAFLTETVDIVDRWKISCAFDDLCYRNALYVINFVNEAAM